MNRPLLKSLRLWRPESQWLIYDMIQSMVRGAFGYAVLIYDISPCIYGLSLRSTYLRKKNVKRNRITQANTSVSNKDNKKPNSISMSTAKWIFYDFHYCPSTFFQAFSFYCVHMIVGGKWSSLGPGPGPILLCSILPSKYIEIFQDDIALVICMIILMAVTAGVVMFKVNKCFINFNLKVHIRVGVTCDLSNIYVNSIFSISTWSMFVLHSNYLKSCQFLVHSDSTSLRNEICRSRGAIIL